MPWAPQMKRHAVLEDEGEAEGQQQAVERIAGIERPDQHPLDARPMIAVRDGAISSAPQKPT